MGKSWPTRPITLSLILHKEIIAHGATLTGYPTGKGRALDLVQIHHKLKIGINNSEIDNRTTEVMHTVVPRRTQSVSKTGLG